MQAEPAAQQTLLKISRIDQDVTRLQHRVKALPEHESLKALAEQRAAISEHEVACSTRLADAQLELQRVEGDLNTARTRLERNEKRSADGSVNDPKALRSLQDEIEHLSGRISNLEDQWLEATQTVEDETAEATRLASRRSEVEDQMRALLKTRDAAVAEIKTELTDLAARRSTFASQVPDDVMTLYDRVAQRQGTGAAELRAQRCGGCGLQINPAALSLIAGAATNSVNRCEECGRILVRTGESGL